MLLIEHLFSKKDKKGHWQSYGLFLCSFCNKKVVKQIGNGKISQSCGCNNRGNFKHGENRTKLYKTWSGVKQRCMNPNSTGYKNYGGRGITICSEWANDYITFRNWALNSGYSEELEINRINNNGNYEPSNCNFITAKENTRQRRTTKLSSEIANEIRKEAKMKLLTRKELAKKYDISTLMIYNIINNKMWENT